jgi:ectoine hydroxylase-related dioxygenase (phytanoyl-CoA dioxygenase family)
MNADAGEEAWVAEPALTPRARSTTIPASLRFSGKDSADSSCSRMPQPPQFPITPDQAELDRMSRDLRFFPCGNAHPQLLTPAQIDRFNREGYLTGIRVFDSAEISAHRTYFDQLLERVVASGGDSYSISSAHLRYGRVYDLLRHPRMVACATDLLGENVVGWGSHYFCKMPHDGKQVAWHQDATYWPISPSKTITIWLAIDDVDRQNGCMRVISGSHVIGHLAHRSTEEAEQSVLGQAIQQPDQYGPVIDLELRAGEVSIHSDLLLHGSEANRSERRRCGLTLRYCPVDVRASMGWEQKGVVVGGTDASGHWANPRRPTDD